MREPVPKTILELLQHGRADADAIAAAGQRPLSYGELRPHAGNTVTVLNSLGIGRNDRVAIVLPNGPDMASAFVAIAAGATTAPLNPAYRQEEFEFYLADLQAKALVVEAESETVAREAAATLGIAILELHPTHALGRRVVHAGRRFAGDSAEYGRRRRTERCGPRASHVGHHLSPETRAVEPDQYLRLGGEHGQEPVAGA